jgi:hypothetical protein
MGQDVAAGIDQKNINDIVILAVDIVDEVFHLQKIHGQQGFGETKCQAGGQGPSLFFFLPRAAPLRTCRRG